jgi:hypothetical protein
MDDLKICVDMRNFNDACIHDPFLTLFTYKVLENVGGCEAYLFIDGISGYHQVQIVEEDQDNMTFMKK